MGNEGAKAVCDLLTENKTITYLDLKGMYKISICYHYALVLSSHFVNVLRQRTKDFLIL